jgi:hypothetical protein
MCTYGYLSIGGSTIDPNTEYVTEFKIDANAAVALAALMAGILAILVGLLGFLAAYCMNPLVTCPFGLLSFLIAILAFVCAGAVFAGSETTLTFYSDICETPFESFGGVTGESYMREQYGALVDDRMCDANCVCEDAAFQIGITPLGSDQALLESYGTVGRETTDSGSDTAPSSYILLQSAADGMKSYDECFSQVIKPAADTANPQWSQFVEDGGYDFMRQMEQDWDCASICYEPLFYLSKGIDQSPVRMDCVTAFVDYYAGNVGVGVVAALMGVILLGGCIGAVPLSSGFATGAMGGG